MVHNWSTDEENVHNPKLRVFVQPKVKKENLSATVISPNGEELDCHISEAEQGTYDVQFTPLEMGDHLVGVFLNGRHVPGSPVTKAINDLDCDPNKIIVYGAGLKGGLLGIPAEFTISALNAGSGALSISINGPTKAKINLTEQFDGTHKATYNTSCSGNYEINIYFAGQPIPGSPYKAFIAATEEEMNPLSVRSDASKCTSYGIGLQMAVVGERASFIVVACKAGRGSVMVCIQGHHNPAEEVSVKHVGENIYKVCYVLEKAGDYILHVLWGGEHIQGSPFHLSAYNRHAFESSL